MNKDIKNLKKEVESKRAVFIIGAGVSLASTEGNANLSWGGLLRSGLDKLNTPHFPEFSDTMYDAYRRILDEGDTDSLVGVAQIIESKLGAPDGGAFSEWLREVFEPVDIKNPEVPLALKRLKEQGCLLVTTNYDDILEKITESGATTWLDQNIVDRMFRGLDSGILHLHGYWKIPASLIFGWSSYGRIESDEVTQHFLRTLRAPKTPIFVGCGGGLEDPNIGRLLDWARKHFRTAESPIYLLDKNDRVDEIRKRYPVKERFVVVDYGKSHQDLGPFLRSLLQPGSPGFEEAAGLGRKHVDEATVHLELSLSVPPEEFNKQALLRVLREHLGIDVSKIHVTSVRSGSTKATLRGDSKELERLVYKVKTSRDVRRNLAVEIGLKSVSLVKGNERRVVRVEAPGRAKKRSVAEKKKPKIFIVHGRDTDTTLEVQDFLQNTLVLGRPIVLRHQKSAGKTLIERFEKASRGVDVAIVILTPDDRAVLASAPDSVKRRARQNVIFELGFWFAKLQRSRGRVLLLYKGKIELPSDISGITYVDISKGVEAAGDEIRRELAPWLKQTRRLRR